MIDLWHGALSWWKTIFFFFICSCFLAISSLKCTNNATEAKTLPADVCVFGCFGQFWSAAVHSADCRFDSRVKWWILLSSIITYLHKNSFLLCWSSCKQCSESSTSCCFWLTVSKRGTLFEHSFLIDKCSCKMVNTLPSDIFNSSAISHNFNLRLAKTNLWSSLVFSGTTAKFGRPECSASFVSVWQRLKSEYHLLAVVYDGAKSE